MVGSGIRLSPGDVLDGRYRIGEVAGEGAMGTVYFAEHTLIGRKVAIKVLRSDLAQDPDVVKRFMNEARAAGTLGHPNICESTDMGFVDGVPYLVLELLEGVVLSDEIFARGALSTRRVLRIAEQIAEALTTAHAAGIIHRDLKSDNVFLTDRDERPDHVKVLDFGISELVDAASKRVVGLPAGTPEFSAPEQIVNPDHVDERADIYALGVVIFHMLAGRRPFASDSLDTLVAQVLHDPPPPLSRLADQPELRLLLGRMLAKRPGDRPQTMREVVDALARMAAAHHTVVGVSRGDTIPPPFSGANPTTPSATVVPERRRRTVVLAVGLVAAIGAGAGIWSLAPSGETTVAAAGSAVTPSDRLSGSAAARDAPSSLGASIDAAEAAGAPLVDGTPSAPPVNPVEPAPPSPAAEIDAAIATADGTPDAAPSTATSASRAGRTVGRVARRETTSPAVPRGEVDAGDTPRPPAALPDAGSNVVPTIPAPAIPAPVAQGPTIDQAAVRAAVRRQATAVQDCYERGRMDNLDLAGRIVLRIVIEPDGRPSTVSVDRSTLGAPKVEACIAKAVQGWQFPVPSGGAVTIFYPFALK